MSSFGDFTDDDAFDTAAADPEQVARKLHSLRVGALLDSVDWDDLDPSQRARIVGVIHELLASLRREGSL